jgi:nicotinate-nucleotide adenylyltransferase
MQQKQYRIGISGGTFDPIHYGHMIIAEQIRESLKLDKVIFIPSGLTPHKDISKVTPAEHRFNMVHAAVQTNSFFEASRIEIEREGYTYTIDTIKQLNEFYGETARLFFITGADVIPELLTWKNHEKLFELCEFIAVLRPGFKKDGFIKEVEHLRTTYLAKIHVVDAPLIGISSTIIREKVKAGKSIKYLVPESVESYIIKNRLYSEKA